MVEYRDDIVDCSRQAEMDITEQVEPMRDIFASGVAERRLDVPEAADCLEAFSWLNRVSRRIACIGIHKQQLCWQAGNQLA